MGGALCGSSKSTSVRVHEASSNAPSMIIIHQETQSRMISSEIKPLGNPVTTNLSSRIKCYAAARVGLCDYIRL
jgi:hypothetical protein